MISVIMPVYNESKYVRKAIDSILSQSFRDFEFIIIDDGSTDNTLDIIKKVKDSRIIVFENSHQGIVAQLNYGISQARYKFIARMDGDDFCSADRLQKQFDILNNNHKIDIIGTNISMVDFGGNIFCNKKYPNYHEDIKFLMPVEMPLCHASVLMKKTIFNNGIRYDNRYEPAEDHKLFLQILSEGYTFYNIQEFLYFYRVLKPTRINSKTKLQNNISYNLGVEYLTNHKNVYSSSLEIFQYHYRLALLDYYRGNIRTSRKHFLKSLKYSNRKIFLIIRYIFPGLLGDKFYAFLRNNSILLKLNLYIKKYLNINTHKIK